MKLRIFGILLLSLFLGLIYGCKGKKKPLSGRQYTGVFFETPYTIDVVGDATDYRQSIDSILKLYEERFDLTNTGSVLSRYNAFQKTDSAFAFVDPTGIFANVYALAEDLNRRTLQYYDPTTQPLKSAWLIYRVSDNLPAPDGDSLYEFIGFDGAKTSYYEREGDHHEYLESYIRKSDPRLQLDFTSLASAYALDKLADFFREKKIPQFRISRGHQVITYGTMVDSLNVVPLGIAEGEADKSIRLINRTFSFKNLADKMQMVDVTYGGLVENEMVFVAVSAPTLAESEVFSETFMIMGYETAGKWYEANETSDIQSFVVFKKTDEELGTASTEAFDKMLLASDSVSTEQ
jgi:thiamine biosynthesis lipoprotein ApbE